MWFVRLVTERLKQAGAHGSAKNEDGGLAFLIGPSRTRTVTSLARGQKQV